MPDEYNADIKIKKGKRIVEQGEFAATNYDSVEKLCNDKKISNNSYVVAWFNNIVKWGKYVQGKLIWVDEKTLEYKQLVEIVNRQILFPRKALFQSNKIKMLLKQPALFSGRLF